MKKYINFILKLFEMIKEKFIFKIIYFILMKRIMSLFKYLTCILYITKFKNKTNF